MNLENFDMKKWKSEALKQYRNYLNTLSADSEEYTLIKRGIEDFEKTVL